MDTPNPTREPKCSICGAYYSAHTAGPCRWCGRPIEHHATGEQADCKAGKARMAAARRPEDRNDTDRAALTGAAR